MKRERTTTPFVCFCMLVLLLLSGCATTGDGPPEGAPPMPEQPRESVTGPFIKEVGLERVGGKERVSILLSEAVDFDVSRESDTVLSVILKGVSLPAGMKKEHPGDGLRNLEQVSLDRGVAEGDRGVRARIFLQRMVPYRYWRNGLRVIFDFDVSALPSEVTPGGRHAAIPAVAKRHVTERPGDKPQAERERQYTGEEISLDFQDADIKSVFRLISEVSGFSIIAGPDVKAEVTVHMEKVPWDQTLDAVLETNGLGKKQSGKVITVLPLEELKKAEEEQQKKGVAQDRLNKISQISIEAKIVEVTTSFSRKLGVQWGGGFQGSWNGVDIGMGAGNSSSGTLALLPGSTPNDDPVLRRVGGIGLTGSSVAVNFPSLTSANAPAIGMVLGTSKMILDAQLQAMEANGDGEIISSPRITTLDGVEATISQGKEVPFQVPATSDKPAYPDFKEVVLELKVTPTITPDGRISMDIYATNKELDWANAVLGMPAIDKSDIDSKIIVKNGDTVVVGGIYKTIETDSTDGVPWLSKIPVLGWLFKTESKIKQKRELLIFVTPKIIEE